MLPVSPRLTAKQSQSLRRRVSKVKVSLTEPTYGFESERPRGPSRTDHSLLTVFVVVIAVVHNMDSPEPFFWRISDTHALVPLK